MKININSEVINSALNYISDILPSKPQIAICGGIFLECKDDNLILMATDLQNTVKISIECDIKEKGQTVIPGKQFISLLKQFKKEEIRIEKKEKFINIISEKGQYSFIEMEIEDFPKLQKFSSEITFKIKGETLKEGFKKTIFCIDPEEPRQQFRGGLFEIKDKFINIIGTDTRRLSLFSIIFGDTFKKQIKVLLTHALMKKMINILNETDVEVLIGKNNISFQTNFIKTTEENKKITGNILIISQLLTGAEEFPDYEKVIPDIKKSKVSKINKDDLLSSLKRISLFTTEMNNKVKLSFKKDLLIISTTGELGEAQEKINISYNEEETDIAFQPDFLIDFLEVIENEEFLFSFTSSLKPVLMKPDEEAPFLYVCMPLKIE
ncbi:MAG: DNA polymerase III subunit beta [Candidatus Omnitrophica bacterium]|nr:DNA polymerase III subunit beta [Candidatus Omnitrophota bacterium]